MKTETKNNSKPVKKKVRKPQSHQVRIIGGLWKRTTLTVADAEGLRPTPDRVRETVFNWIGHLRGADWGSTKCLDLFAGTGALGFEAASRGAAQVTMIEATTPIFLQLEAVKAKLNALQVNLVRADALRAAQAMAERGQQFDVIFLDPPYQQDLLPKALSACLPLLAKNGLVYAEFSSPLDRKEGEEALEFMADWEIIRADKAGMVFYYLLQSKKSADIQA